MNKLFIMVLGVATVMGMIGKGHADDTLTGFYAGVNTAVVFNQEQLRSQQLGFTDPSETCNANSSYSFFSPGLQLGHAHHLPNNFVLGTEVSVNVNSNQNNKSSCHSDFNEGVYDGFKFSTSMQGAIKARGGYLINWQNHALLPYLTLGASFTHVGLTYQNEGGDFYSKSDTVMGWLVGAGIEWPFIQHWSLRVEYNYVDYGNAITLKLPSVYGLDDSNGKGRIDLSANNIAVSINYWA